MKHGQMAELKDELKEALDEAIDAANSLQNRLAEFKAELAERTPAAIADGYEKGQTALEQITWALLDLRHLREAIDLNDFDLDELEAYLEVPETEEDAGDREYHEAKDEGKLK